MVTAGGLVFSAFADGTFTAFDDQTMEMRWKINIGSGFTAPPISFAVNGKQYIAIATGLSRIARGTLAKSPEEAAAAQLHRALRLHGGLSRRYCAPTLAPSRLLSIVIVREGGRSSIRREKLVLA